jgi:hypothetical protein
LGRRRFSAQRQLLPPHCTSQGLVAYAAIGGLATGRSRIVQAVLLLAVLSSSVATMGNFFLDPPSQIGRANWAERQLVSLEAMREVQFELSTSPR